jgi:thymidylate synthase
MRIFESVHDAYLYALADIYDNPDATSSPRGQKVREKFNYQFTIKDPKVEPIVTLDPERNVVIKDYSQKEFDLYESCSNLVEDFGKASKFWLKLANPDGTINSAYGYLVWKRKSHGSPFETKLEVVSPPRFEGDGTISHVGQVQRTPWEWCLQALIADKDTRQAILRFSLPEHFWVGNKDFTCTLHGYFQIRDNKLSLTINMRSNDMTLGLVYDLPWFISLIHRMRDDLKSVYPDLEIGNYTHYVHNIHVYDRDEDKILKMLGRK